MKQAQDLSSIKEQIKLFPSEPGVYIMKNLQDKILYIGKAKNLKSRVKSYFNKTVTIKTQYLLKHLYQVHYILTQNEVEAFLLEASLIKKHKPRYNIRLKDDKSYPYICCNLEHKFPRFYLTRKIKEQKSQYFGPYTNAIMAKKMIAFLSHSFGLRDCEDRAMNNRQRACLSYQMQKCTAPCVNKISTTDYQVHLNKALDILNHKNSKVIKILEKEMDRYSKAENFEQAAKKRDQISIIKDFWGKQSLHAVNKKKNQDFINCFADHRGTSIVVLHFRKSYLIGSQSHFIPKFNFLNKNEEEKEWLSSFLNQFYSEHIIPDEIFVPFEMGYKIVSLLQKVFLTRQKNKIKIKHIFQKEEKNIMDLALKNAEEYFKTSIHKQEDSVKALKVIQKKLQLKNIPSKMECFDISHLQGSHTVGSQVVFQDGEPLKAQYRRYKIKAKANSDDYLSMKELLTRRLKHSPFSEDTLLVIDGGKGQLQVAVEVLKELKAKISVVSIAKARTLKDFQSKKISETKERFFIPGRKNPITFDKKSESLRILTYLRDEAHRFAISYHRFLREKPKETKKSKK
ncbi:MAG: excinuclease ABC subunit UvrC [Bdellovibrionaceae bacterium]|nr:excinuclease ABC subunit UvrC [Pseudobdellovibrionaceae bacterium]